MSALVWSAIYASAIAVLVALYTHPVETVIAVVLFWAVSCSIIHVRWRIHDRRARAREKRYAEVPRWMN